MNINGKHYRTIWPNPADRTEIIIIDQRKLPHLFLTRTLRTVENVIAAIKEMQVRGAGLIGATAGYGVYLAALAAPDNHFDEYIREKSIELDDSRPTARNLKWAVERVCRAMESGATPAQKREIAFLEANTIADEDIFFCKQIGKHGLEIIRKISKRKNGKAVNILTHCNAGWLAFVDYGSATAPIYAARDSGINVHIWVDETRPWNQGSRLTAWELQQERIDNTLICDNTGGHLMQHGLVDLVIVGTDRTTHTGDVANKIGTYLKALAAYDNNIPFYVALPSPTIDWTLDNGMEIPIEQRTGEEITTITGIDTNNSISTISLAAEGTQAANYSFDITPARLITGLITERGIIAADKKAIHTLFPEERQINRQEQGIS